MPTDILIDANADTIFKNGDIAVGESTLQHQRCLLKTIPGELKQFPIVGVGIDGFVKDELPSSLPSKIKSEFQKDGMTVKSIKMTDTQLKIDASYKETTDTD